MIDAYILKDIITDHNLCKTQKETLQSVIDKIENGTLIELPCKVGDKFYGICDFVIFEYTTLAIKLVREHKICLCTVYDIEFILGKDCFLTLEEAEKRLLELQGDK